MTDRNLWSLAFSDAFMVPRRTAIVRIEASEDPAPRISAFLTIESLTNFAAMTGAISAAWFALGTFFAAAQHELTVLALALAFGAISYLLSWRGLEGWSNRIAAAFIALLNSLILASAVLGMSGMAANITTPG